MQKRWDRLIEKSIFYSFIVGCDFKLQNENCADQCKLLSIDEQIEASCIVGCSMNEPVGKKIDLFVGYKLILEIW